MNTRDWFPSGWTGWISLQSNGLSRVFSNTTVQKHQFFGAQLSLWSNSHIHTWLLEKNIALTIWTFVNKVISLLFNKLCSFVIAFLPRSKGLLISWLLSPLAVILEPNKTKSHTVSIFFPSICHEVTGSDAMILVFLMLSFKDLLIMALPTRARPSFPHSQSFPSRSLHKPLSLICQRADKARRTIISRMKTTIIEI